jgi:hypothetical protein
MAANVYDGVRSPRGPLVYINGQNLDARPSLTLASHSPDGFEWGYSGSGPAQLALAILLNEYGAARSLELYQDFKHDVISRFASHWHITSAEISDWLSRKKGRHDA